MNYAEKLREATEKAVTRAIQNRCTTLIDRAMECAEEGCNWYCVPVTEIPNFTSAPNHPESQRLMALLTDGGLTVTIETVDNKEYLTISW